MAAKKSAPVVAPQNSSVVAHPTPASLQTSIAELVQRATHHPTSLNTQQVLQLQRTLGNHVVSQLVGKAATPTAPRENRTGLPDSLKSGIESLSGMAMDDVTVHLGSDKPAQVGAAAYAQGSTIHIAPGQEQHLPHEAWHVVQQKQARVRPTLAVSNVPINDDPALESEATDMGARAMQLDAPPPAPSNPLEQGQISATPVAQGWFEGFPSPDEVALIAVKKGLAPVYIQLLEWAALAPFFFGPLGPYLDNPHLIETLIYPRFLEEHPQNVPEEAMDTTDTTSKKRTFSTNDAEPPAKRLKLNPALRFTMPKIKGIPLELNNEIIPGSSDLPANEFKELKRFRVAVNEAEYTKDELRSLDSMLEARGAPHDKERRQVLRDAAYELVHHEFDEAEKDFLNADFEVPELAESDDESFSSDSDSAPENGKDKSKAKVRRSHWVPGEPLRIDGEIVEDTRDAGSESEDDLEEFQTGLNEAEYTTEQLATLSNMLVWRNAPRDKKRREILEEYVDYRQGADQEQEDTYEQTYEELHKTGIEYTNYDSGTDTEGSDTEDNEDYKTNEPRREAAQSRMTRATPFLRGDLLKGRLANIKDKKKKNKDGVMFKGGHRPKKSKIYRKEAKFYDPPTPKTLKVGDKAKLPNAPTPKEVQDMAQLNALLELGVSPELASQLVDSEFVVAQYRGLFYNKNLTTHNTRAQHRDLDEKDKPVFSASALAQGDFGMAGYYYLYNKPERKEDLALYQRHLQLEALRIREKLLAMRRQPVTAAAKKEVPNATGRFKPESMGDLSTHYYSQAYDKYHKTLETNQSAPNTTKHALDPISKPLPNANNPKVSTGDVPLHATRYAYGLKPYAKHEEELLEPSYDDKGKPLHPYTGKLYVSLHPLSDYEEETGPSPLVHMQNAGRINIGQVIIPERESQFEGMLPGDRIKAQIKAKFPDFSKPYKLSYKDRYGLEKEMFTQFKEAFKGTQAGTTERVFVEALLSNYLAKYSEFRAIDAAVEEAQKQGARLVYRTGFRSFGFDLPPILSDNQKATVPKPKTKPTSIVEAINLIVKHAISFQKESDSSSNTEVKPHHAAPTDLHDQVAATFAPIISIKGSDIACYIRSLVTGAVLHRVIKQSQIENIVAAIQDHLAHVNLRTRGQMVDAGGLVAAEVQRVLKELSGKNFDPAVHIVMWDPTLGTITDFLVNTGTHAVWLFYTPGHFDLITRK